MKWYKSSITISAAKFIDMLLHHYYSWLYKTEFQDNCTHGRLHVSTVGYLPSPGTMGWEPKTSATRVHKPVPLPSPDKSRGLQFKLNSFTDYIILKPNDIRSSLGPAIGVRLLTAHLPVLILVVPKSSKASGVRSRSWNCFTWLIQYAKYHQETCSKRVEIWIIASLWSVAEGTVECTLHRKSKIWTVRQPTEILYGSLYYNIYSFKWPLRTMTR